MKKVGNVEAPECFLKDLQHEQTNLFGNYATLHLEKLSIYRSCTGSYRGLSHCKLHPNKAGACDSFPKFQLYLIEG